MKVTVTFNTVKIVVPCGDGEITVRELTQLATTRYKKATGKPKLSWVSVHSLKAKEGGILDPDDRLVDVCDDREQLIAFYDEEGIPQGGDGMSASSDESETTGGSSGGYTRNTDIEVSGDYAAIALQVRRGSEPALNKLDSQGRGGGELLLSLCHQPAARRLSVVILKARNVPVMDITGFSGEATISS